MVVERLPQRIDGPRLVLRRWTPSDVQLLADSVGRNVEHLRPWMPWIADEPLAISERKALVERWQREWRKGSDVVMAVVLDGRVVGGTGLHRRRGPHSLEIGYWVDKDHLGQGIATETARMLTTAALALPAVDFVEIHHDRANRASGRVPQHLGYRWIGEAPDRVVAPGETGIDCTWRMTRAEWMGSVPVPGGRDP